MSVDRKPAATRAARVALTQAFEAVQQLAHPGPDAPGCPCSVPAVEPGDDARAWVTQAGAQIALVRMAWLKAGLPPQTRRA